MAPPRALFTVFCDAPSNPTIAKRNNPNKLLVFSDAQANANGGKGEWNGKENFDPFLVGKPNPTAMKGKKVVRSIQKPVTIVGTQMKKPTPTMLGNNNGICTGTLFTRTLPSPPPLPKHYSLKAPLPFTRPLPPSRQPTLTPRNYHDDITFLSSASSSPFQLSMDDIDIDSPGSSGSSMRDSGYARSGSDFDALSGSEDSGSEMELDEEDLTLTIGTADTNRLARGLTESPLAEVTQAFTSFGSFALPSNASQTPNSYKSPSRFSSRSAAPFPNTTTPAPSSFSATLVPSYRKIAASPPSSKSIRKSIAKPTFSTTTTTRKSGAPVKTSSSAVMDAPLPPIAKFKSMRV